MGRGLLLKLGFEYFSAVAVGFTFSHLICGARYNLI